MLHAVNSIYNLKKVLAALTAVALMLALTAPALAATTGTVSATVTAQLISLSVADGDVSYGVLDADTFGDTVGTETQTVTNNGNVAEDFGIKSSGASSAGTPWNLAASTGTDEFTHDFSVNSGANWTAFNVDNAAYTAMSSNIAKDGTDTFDLRIKTPVTSTDTLEHTITVTVLATAT